METFEALESLNLALLLFGIAAPLILGAYMVLFSQRWSVGALRHRKRVWRIDYTELDVKVGQIFGLVIGIGFVAFGLINAATLLT